MSESAFIARDSWWRVAAAIVLCLLMIWFCAVLAGLIGPAQSLKRQVIGWAVLVPLVPVTIGFMPRLLGKKVRVEISSRGIYSRSWSGETIPWNEIARISTWGDKSKSHNILLYLKRPDRFPASNWAGRLSKMNALFGVHADIWIGFATTDHNVDEALAAIDRFQKPAEPAAHPVSSLPSFGRRSV